MKHIVATLATALFAFAMSGLPMAACAANAGTRVDGTNEQTAMNTLGKIMSEQGKKGKCLLQAALMNIQIGRQLVSPGSAGDAPKPLRDLLNGMDYAQILAFSRHYPARVVPVCRD